MEDIGEGCFNRSASVGVGGSVQGCGSFLLAKSEKQLLLLKQAGKRRGLPPWLPSSMLNKVSFIHFTKYFLCHSPENTALPEGTH